MPKHSLRRSIVSAMLAGLVSIGLRAIANGDTLAGQADAYLTSQAAEYNLPGASAAISVDGTIVWTGSAGYSDLENNIPATGAMVHRIASITKSMTATAIMQLVEEGEIKLNDPVRKHLRSYPKKEKGTVRIHHLLTHTSGMRHYLGKENRPFTHYDTLEDAVAVFQGRRLAFAPGYRYLYTTYGYTLLGAVIESASGQTYEEYMRERIWGPAGMTSTQLEDRARALPDRAKLYRRDPDGSLVEDAQTDLSIKYPGGGLLSTAGDLVRFAMAFEDGRLVESATRERMRQVPELDYEPARAHHLPYALGWIVGDSEPFGRFIRNDGGQSGTSTNLLVCQDARVIVAVLSNVAGAGSEVAEITNGLAAIALEMD